MSISIGSTNLNRHVRSTIKGKLLAVFEILFFCYLFYTHISGVIDIYVPGLAGAWLLSLAVISLFYSLLNHDNHKKTALILVGIFTLIFMLVQFYFGVSFLVIKSHFVWVAYIVIIYPQIYRPNFIKHLVIVLTSIILILLPFITFIDSGDVARAYIFGTGIDNANVVGTWIGFCALFYWLWGGTANSWKSKFLLYSLAILLLGYMLQTVSRGSLVGLLIAIAISFRQDKIRVVVVKLVLLLSAYFILLNIPLVANTIVGYQTRMFVDTGRFEVWPSALEMIKNQPWLGYGANHVLIFVFHRYLLPHNVFLYMLVAGGIISTVPFVILWLNTLIASFWPKQIIKIRGIDPLPLTVFVLIQFMSYDVAYISIFSALVICYSLSQKSHKRIPFL
jgi:O-antigen ligase